VFCIADDDDNDWFVRIAASEPDVIYIADKAEKTIYYSTDGGTEKWTVRTSRYDIGDRLFRMLKLPMSPTTTMTRSARPPTAASPGAPI